MKPQSDEDHGRDADQQNEAGMLRAYACYHFGKVVAYGLRELLSRNQE